MVGAALWLPRASGWPNPHFLSSSEDHKCIQIQIQIQIQIKIQIQIQIREVHILACKMIFFFKFW